MYWTLYKNVFDKKETKRGLKKEPLSSPKVCFENLFKGGEIDFSTLF
jgi:hypothetical protein